MTRNLAVKHVCFAKYLYLHNWSNTNVYYGPWDKRSLIMQIYHIYAYIYKYIYIYTIIINRIIGAY